MSTCNWLDLQTLGSQPVMPKNLPDHCPRSLHYSHYLQRLHMRVQYQRHSINKLSYWSKAKIWTQGVYTTLTAYKGLTLGSETKDTPKSSDLIGQEQNFGPKEFTLLSLLTKA